MVTYPCDFNFIWGGSGASSLHILLWSYRVLLPGDLASHFVCRFQVWKLTQFRKLGKGSWLSIELVAHSFLIFRLHRMRNILGDWPPNLNLSSIKHLTVLCILDTILPQSPCCHHICTYFAQLPGLQHFGILLSAFLSGNPVLSNNSYIHTFSLEFQMMQVPPPAYPSYFGKWCIPWASPWNKQMKCLLALDNILLSIPTSNSHLTPSSTAWHENFVPTLCSVRFLFSKPTAGSLPHH